MKLECSRCGHSWNYKGNKYRAICVKCRNWIRTGLPSPWSKNASVNASVIKDDIMHGNIIEALEK